MSHATMSMSSSSNSSASGGMVPYLHFAGGDFLFIQQWAPTSPGAIAGACIGLVILALFDRWLAATRSLLDAHWRRKAFVLTAPRDQTVTTVMIASGVERDSTDSAVVIKQEISTTTRDSNEPKVITIKSRLRTITPFIPAHDIPRGVLYALQMLIAYLQMLAVMTFQAAYIISIALGLGIGEILFGRVGGHGGAH